MIATILNFKKSIEIQNSTNSEEERHRPYMSLISMFMPDQSKVILDFFNSLTRTRQIELIELIEEAFVVIQNREDGEAKYIMIRDRITEIVDEIVKGRSECSK